MNSEKMAEFIAALRKEKRMTQKDLAAQLGVTDKAVSKWERGLSCPDIALLSSLSDILGVTTGELLNGERTESSSPEIEAVVNTTLAYADTATKNKAKTIRKTAAYILSGTAFLGILTCVICNFAISGGMTWAWIPVSSIIYLWILTVPIILWMKKGVCVSLIFLSVFTIPFLYVLEKTVGMDGQIVPIGARTALIGILYCWIIYILFLTKLRKYAAAAISVLLGIPVAIGINFVLVKWIAEPVVDLWDIVTYSILAAAAIAIFVWGRMRRQNAKNR